MLTEKLKQQFAESTAQAFRDTYPEKFEELGAQQVFDPEYVLDNLDKPKDPRMGRA